MNWLTVYEIKTAWIPWMVGVLCIILYCLFRGIKEYMTEEEMSVPFFLTCLFGFIIVCVMLVVEIYQVISGEFNLYGKAYSEKRYQIAEGVPQNTNWHNGGFRFKIDSTEFFCDLDYGKNRNENVVPYFDNQEKSMNEG